MASARTKLGIWAALALLAGCAPESPPPPPPVAVAPPPAPLDDFARTVLAAHNAERARLHLAALAWSPMLAAYARVWAREMAQRGTFMHSAAESRPGQGENLWMGTAGAFSPQQMIGDFLAERRDFRPGVFPAVSSSGDWEAVGHYTQMIWPTTRALGCAVVSGGGNDWLVCRYAPWGNVMGARVG